ncbi:MAG TPA: ABC transporter permease [Acidimicrobiales bacterium]|nr:ABC transporter permease [Acidimicrobiales bacterium]
MKRLGLVAHQFRYDYRSYVREPTAVFFTAFLPLMFLVLIVGVFGNQAQPIGGGRRVSGATYYVPSIMALAVVSATAVNLAVSVATARERGTLKRLRATPLPPWVFLAARVVTQVITVTLIAGTVLLLGRVAYNVHLPPSAWPALLVTLAVGIACFCCVGFLMTLVIASEQAAAAVANALTLPLNFISGVFFPRGTIPQWMTHIAELFPIKHLVDALFTVFDPGNHGSRLAGRDLLVLTAWGVVSLVISARRFRWVPSNR